MDIEDKNNKVKSKILLKIQVFKEYGNKCVNCKCTNLPFLSIDHIDETGADHRKEIGADIYTWLKQNNFPKDNFQLLCFNCNYEKSQNIILFTKSNITASWSPK
jgi:hypothetical protein